MCYSVGVGAQAVGDFGMEAAGGTDDGYEGGGVEEVEDAGGCDLVYKYKLVRYLRESWVYRWWRGTSPPPMTRTGLSLTCQAIMREPLGWTGG